MTNNNLQSPNPRDRMRDYDTTGADIVNVVLNWYVEAEKQTALQLEMLKILKQVVQGLQLRGQI